jgi:hypothetical protein
MRSVQPSFGQFYRDPKVYFAQDVIKSGVARAVLEVGSDRFKPQKRRLIERAGQESKLKLIEGIKRTGAVFDGAAAPFQWILYTLQCNQGVDAAERSQRYRRTLCLRRARFGQRKGTTAGTPCCNRRPCNCRSVWSGDTHR